MLRHLTSPAWDALEGARAAAGARGAAAIGPEHLLLGLLRDRSHRAARALTRCGVVFEELAAGAQSAAGADVGGGEDARAAFDAAARRVLEHAAAMSRGVLDTGCLLKALARDRASRASRVLAALGADGRAVDRAVASLPVDEPEGPLIDESDPLFDAMGHDAEAAATHAIDGIDVVAAADALDLGMARLGRTDDYARALALALRPPRRRHWVGDALLGWCGVAELASIAVVLTGLAEFGVTQGLWPSHWYKPIHAVPFAGLVALAVASVSMLAAAGFGLWSAVRASQQADAPAILARVPRWLALGMMGTLIGGAPGIAVFWRQLTQLWSGGLPLAELDLLPLWAVGVVCLHCWAWRVHRRTRTALPSVPSLPPGRSTPEPTRDEHAR